MRAFARFSLSLSLSLFQRPNSSPSLSFTRCAYEMLQRDKKTEERERKQKEKVTPKRKFTQNRDDWENEFVRTHHSCELAYFNPSMTVLYICTPLARLNKGANAVVLEVNCFKVCLSAMMKSCVVVRVKCDAQSVPPLFHPLSRRGGSLVLAFFACFFVFFKGERRARERTRRSIFFFWISSLFGRTRRRRRERSFLCFCPLFLLVLLLLFLFLSLFLFRENEKRTTLFDALFLFPHL